MKSEIKDNLYDLYGSYNQHKLLFEYWKERKDLKGIKEIEERIEYIRKNRIKQRNELETLLWVIGKVGEENAND